MRPIQRDRGIHRVRHDMLRIGNHVVVGNPKVGFVVAELTLDERFDDKEEAVEFAIEQKEQDAESEFVDLRRRSW